MWHVYPNCKSCPSWLKVDSGEYIGPVYVIGVVAEKIIPGSVKEDEIMSRMINPRSNICLVDWKRVGKIDDLQGATISYISKICHCQPTATHICFDFEKVYDGGATSESIRRDFWRSSDDIALLNILIRLNFESTLLSRHDIQDTLALPQCYDKGKGRGNRNHAPFSKLGDGCELLRNSTLVFLEHLLWDVGAPTIPTQHGFLRYRPADIKERCENHDGSMRKLVVFSKVEQRKYIYAGSYRFELNEGGCPVIEDEELSDTNDPAIRERLLGKLR